jgi:threonine dehydratase
MIGTARSIPIEAVREAAAALSAMRGAAVRTPLVQVDLPAGPRTPPDLELYLKLEVLQPMGAFKIRGALNVVRQLTPDQLAGGVWTVSAGNAALGVASPRGGPARCSVMVADTAPTPSSRHRAPRRRDRQGVIRRVLAHGRTARIGSDDRLLHPSVRRRSFHRGQRDRGLEIMEDLPDVDAVVASIGGGGLLAGVAASVRALNPNVRVYAAEPETAAPLSASLAAGRPVAFSNWRASFVDGAGGKSVLDTMWPLLRDLDGSIVVSLDDVAAAIKATAERAHVIAEGAGGCAVAAALSGAAGRGQGGGDRLGGNIDLTRFASLVGARA